MLTLSPRQRAVVTLHVDHDLQPTEVAAFDACAADQTLSLKMQNAPVRLVVEAVCEQLNLSDERREGVLHIGWR